MKKLLLSSVILLLFSISLFLFQISCQKNLAATPLVSQPTGIILYAIGNDGNGANGGASSYWTTSGDGFNFKYLD